MRKGINGMMVFWLVMTMISGNAETTDLRYEIIFDSMTKNEIEIKDAILTVYQDLVHGVDEEDRSALVLKNQNRFQLKEEWKIYDRFNTIVIEIGDAKGTCLTGSFEWGLCHNEIKPRSWILEMIGY